MNAPVPTPAATGLKPVEVRYEHSKGLPELLERLELSVLLSTYQAGLVVSVGSHRGEHDLAWGCERLWLVNTLFNGLVSIKGDWSFVPQWQPPFISGWDAGDRCHLNGLAMAEDGSAPAYVTALGETDTENGWREHKATGGCVIHLPSGEVVLQGLDCIAGRAFVGLSQNRKTAVFGGLQLQDSQQGLLYGLAIVDLATGALRELRLFHRGLEKVFAGCVVMAALNRVLSRPDIDSEPNQPSCLGPPVPTD
jgi:hypothetical protein